MQKQQKISIITINYNNQLGLRDTIRSVIRQTYRNVEYLIVDGGSEDGSKECIQEFAKHISFSVSAKDNGIYHAMNKGIRHATGDYLLFLNSGDYFLNDKVLETLHSNLQDVDLLYGNIVLENGGERIENTFPSQLTFSYFLNNSLPHCCTLIKKSLFDMVGHYKENNMIVSDWEFFLIAINKYQCTYRYIPVPIAVHDVNGISGLEINQSVIQQEKNLVLQKYFSTFIPDYEAFKKQHYEVLQLNNEWSYRLHKILKNLYRKIMNK